MLPAQHGNQNLEFVMIEQKSPILKQLQKSQYHTRGVAKVNLLRPAMWPLGETKIGIGDTSNVILRFLQFHSRGTRAATSCNIENLLPMLGRKHI